jgi:hypothetical protein
MDVGSSVEGDSKKSSISFDVMSGGPESSSGNCCSYGLGLLLDTGEPLVQHEDWSSGHVEVRNMHKGVLKTGLGSLKNKKIGIRYLLWHDGGHVYLQGEYDAGGGSGAWKRFFYDVDPQPLITHAPMKLSKGPNQVARIRIDGAKLANCSGCELGTGSLCGASNPIIRQLVKGGYYYQGECGYIETYEASLL